MPSFAAPDGTTLAYDAHEPEGQPHAAVLLLHDWGGHAGRHAWLGERLNRAGFAAFAVDLRGHGRSGGARGHLSRFSQLLGDLQAWRRAIRVRVAVPQVLFGHGFGGLVLLRYLETQPSVAPAGTIVSGPLLRMPPAEAAWRRMAARLFAGVWPSLALPFTVDIDHLSRDPQSNAAHRRDPAVHRVMTAGARLEIAWAQRAVVADSARIGGPLLFLLAGDDRLADAHFARTFAESIPGPVTVRWYAEMYHELMTDPQRERVVEDVLAFLAGPATAGTPDA